jgi:hypothetical protein
VCRLRVIPDANLAGCREAAALRSDSTTGRNDDCNYPLSSTLVLYVRGIVQLFTAATGRNHRQTYDAGFMFRITGDSGETYR